MVSGEYLGWEVCDIMMDVLYVMIKVKRNQSELLARRFRFVCMNVVFRNSYEIKCGHDRADECTLYIRIII